VEAVEKNEKKRLGEERDFLGNNFYFVAGAASIGRDHLKSPLVADRMRFQLT